MALTKCGECGKEISDKAESCPNCGAPITASAIDKSKKKKPSRRLYRNIFFIFIVLLIAAGLFGKDDNKAAENAEPGTERAEQSTQQTDQTTDPCADIKTMEDWNNSSKLWQMTNAECKPDQQSAQEVLDVWPAAQLWKEFNDNEVAAEKKYKGKTVAIEGRIHSIESSVLGYPELVFNIAHGIQTVRCRFPKKQSDTIAEMKKGQSVLVIGKVETFVLGSVLNLGDCYFGERVQ